MKIKLRGNCGMSSNATVDLLWGQALEELDAWDRRESEREETFVKSFELCINDVQRRQKSAEEIVNHLMNKQREWEKSAREEFLTATAGFQYIFPVKSYEEINRVSEDIQEKTAEISSLPLRNLTNSENYTRIVESVKSYINLRKKSRAQYVARIKELSKVIQDNQQNMIQLYTQYAKNMLFPIQKYIEQSKEFTESKQNENKEKGEEKE